jgi:hypothetical protein
MKRNGPGGCWGRLLARHLVQLPGGQVAGDGEDCGDGEQCVGGVVGQVGPALRFAAALVPVVVCCVEGRDGEQQRGEGVEVHGLEEVAVEEGGEGAGSSAARALQVEPGVDGAAGIDGVAVGWEAEEQGCHCRDACERGSRVGANYCAAAWIAGLDCTAGFHYAEFPYTGFHHIGFHYARFHYARFHYTEGLPYTATPRMRRDCLISLMRLKWYWK